MCLATRPPYTHTRTELPNRHTHKHTPLNKGRTFLMTVKQILFSLDYFLSHLNRKMKRPSWPELVWDEWATRQNYNIKWTLRKNSLFVILCLWMLRERTCREVVAWPNLSIKYRAIQPIPILRPQKENQTVTWGLCTLSFICPLLPCSFILVFSSALL